jgi:endonuclease/exonuclease/phosphatase family metal-dependent hydrolase
MVVINAYMPCRGQYSNAEFQQEIDQLEEICLKFHDYHIVLAGDFNIDTSKNVDSRTRYFTRFVKNNDLQEVFKIEQPTFRQHSGKGHSKIDYIFINNKLKEAMSTAEYKVLQDPLNCSDHDALFLKVTFKQNVHPTPEPRSVLTVRGRLDCYGPKWT